jgi:hypothetical protein
MDCRERPLRPVRGFLLGICAAVGQAQAHPGPAGDPALDASLTACIETHHGNAEPSGLRPNAPASLADRCPQLLAQLPNHPLRTWLEPDLGPHPSLGELLDLRALNAVPTMTEHGSPRLRMDRLRAVLGPLQDISEPAAGRSWWERLLEWLRDLWSTDDSQDTDSLWLRAWLERLSLSEPVAKTLVRALIGVILLLAAWVVIDELRAAGLLSRHRARPAAPSKARSRRPESGPETPPDWERLRALPPSLQIVALLQVLLTLFRQRGLLPRASHLTAAELPSALRLPEAPERRLLASVATRSEAWVYGGIAPSAELVGTLLTQARAFARSEPRRPATSLRSRA